MFVFLNYTQEDDVSLPEYIVVADLNAHTPILHLGDHTNITGSNLELLLSREDACPVNLFTYTNRRTGNQSCLDFCLASCNLVDLSESYEGCC